MANEVNWRRVLLAGPVGCGKSHMALTAELGCQVLYTDRMGGDDDLVGLEDAGVWVHRVDQKDPRTDMLAMIGKLENGLIQQRKLKSVVWDTCTYTTKHDIGKVTNNNLNGMVLTQNKKVAFDILDICRALFQLPLHVIILAHLKEEMIKNAKKEIIGKIWKPDMLPSTLKEISREVSLMGYPWKKTEPGKPNRYGVCFAHQLGHIQFADVKAPNGWGQGEPANLRLLFQRLDEEAEAKRAAARAALSWDIDQSKDEQGNADIPSYAKIEIVEPEPDAPKDDQAQGQSALEF